LRKQKKYKQYLEYEVKKSTH